MAERILKLNIIGDTASLEKALTQAQNASTKFEGGMSGLKASLEAATPGSEALATGLLGLGAAVAGGVGYGVKLAADLEQADIAFTTMLGSAEKSKQMIADLQKFAAGTPFEFPEIQQSAKSLLAFGVAAKDIPGTLTKLGDISAGVGVPLKDLSDIFGKAKTQGRLFAEDINQLTGRGIPIIQELAKQFGVSESEVKKLVEQGKVGFPELDKAFTSLTAQGSKFGGMMKAQSNSVSGVFSTLKDTVFMGLAGVGKAFLDAFNIKDKMKGLTDGIGAFSKELQDLQAKGNTFSQALGKLIPPETKAVIAVVAGAITMALVPAFYSAAAGAWAMIAPLTPFLAVGAAVGALAYLIYSKWNAVKPMFMAFWTPIRNTVVSIWNSLKAALIDVWNSISMTATTVFGALKTFWDEHGKAILSILIPVFNQVKLTVTTAINIIKDTIGFVLSVIRGDWEGAWERIKGVAETIWGFIKGSFKNLMDGLKNMASGALEIGKHLVEGIWEGVKSMASWIAEKVSEFINKYIIKPIKTALRIKSPSQVMAEVGQFTAQGFADGITSGASTVEGAAYGLAKAANIPAQKLSFSASAGAGRFGQFGHSGNSQTTQTIIIQLDGRTIAKTVVQNMPSVLRLAGVKA